MRNRLLVSLWLSVALFVGCPDDNPTDDDATADDDAVDDDDATTDDDATADDDVADDDSAAGDDDSAPGDDDTTPSDDDDTTPSDDDDTTAGDDDDTEPTCGTIGTFCTNPSPCSAGETCYIGGSGGVCVPTRDGCGGFAGATCNDPGYPICMYLDSADFGVCVHAFEKDCICNTNPTVMAVGEC